MIEITNYFDSITDFYNSVEHVCENYTHWRTCLAKNPIEADIIYRKGASILPMYYISTSISSIIDNIFIQQHPTNLLCDIDTTKYNMKTYIIQKSYIPLKIPNTSVVEILKYAYFYVDFNRPYKIIHEDIVIVGFAY